MLLSPYKLRSLELANRVVVSPMGQYSADERGFASDWHLVHLGNLSLSGAALLFTEATAVEAEGWTLRRNAPFSGAYICSAYGRPAQNVHVVQLEIDRSLYMDEATITPRADFDDFAARIARVIGRLSGLGQDHSGGRVAAE